MPKSDLILLAIDDVEIRNLFERALYATSYQVAIAQDKPELDLALQASSPALIILSLDFVGEDGLEIAASVLERFPTLAVLLFLHDQFGRRL